MQRRMRALLPNQKSAPYYFIAPLFIIFSLFIVYPIVDSFIMSFQTFKAGKYLFAGLDNYATLVR
ncbi:MAG: arabinose transporter permease, partial [Clostridia bacterium]